MSLKHPHPIWTSAKSNPYEVNKARIQAIMLSGRYRTESLTKHWTHRDGSCLAPGCRSTCIKQVETIEHLLLVCPSLANIRERVFTIWTRAKVNFPQLAQTISKAMTGKITFRCQFLLDCSVLPEVIVLVQLYGQPVLDQLFYLTRTYCYCLHRERMKILGKWKTS